MKIFESSRKQFDISITGKQSNLYDDKQSAILWTFIYLPLILNQADCWLFIRNPHPKMVLIKTRKRNLNCYLILSEIQIAMQRANCD